MTRTPIQALASLVLRRRPKLSASLNVVARIALVRCGTARARRRNPASPKRDAGYGLLIPALAGVVLSAGAASAHAFLKTATPAVGSTLQTAPSQLVIDFTEGVEPKFSTIAVQDASGANAATGEVHLVGGATHLAIGLAALKPGRYTVTWHVTAVDTHKTEGTYSFTIAH